MAHNFNSSNKRQHMPFTKAGQQMQRLPGLLGSKN